MMSDILIEWNPELETGYEIIDSHHIKIIATVNILYGSIQKNKGPDDLIKIIEDLDFYTNEHFFHEEKLCEDSNFDKTEQMKKSHSSFKNIYEEIRDNCFYCKGKEISQTKSPKIMTIHLITVLKDWLDYHFKTLDKELAEHLRNKKFRE